MALLRNLELNLVESPLTMSHGDSPGDVAPSSGGFEQVGAELRAARERLGWTLAAVAAQLRIRLPLLQAIEEGRIAGLPGNAYAVGFVRVYAQAVGLDAAAVAGRFRVEAAGVNRQTELDFPTPVPERGVPTMAAVAVGLVLTVGAYAGWYALSDSERRSVDTVPEVPDRLASLADKPVVDKPVVERRAAEPVEMAPAAKPVASAPELPAPLAAPAPAAATSVAAMTPPAADATRVVLRAKADAWMRVRDKRTGEVLLSRVLKSGETWPVPARPLPLLLTAGNVSGTELLVDGVPAPPFGVEGRVLRDLPLDPDALKAGRVATNALRQPPHNP